MGELSKTKAKRDKFVSVAAIPITGGIGYFVTKVIDRWGVLDAAANSMGDFLKAHVSGGDLGIVLWLLTFCVLYGAVLYLVRRPPTRETQTTAPAKYAPIAPDQFFARPSRYRKETQATDEELEYWRNVDQMKVWQAAYLWVGKLPAKDYPANAPGVVKALAERMGRDVKTGKLAVLEPFSRDKNPRLALTFHLVGRDEYSTVSRDALVNYAKLTNEQPRFLSPP
ncbi:hypothetical protein [Sphingopyxis sp. YF1]|uniref:hypothetical protein n=1 Tax=Sphingopyxis sp. YF1 TaxID=2482763 RepID=UPI001F608095|nr:hypothetical protein [Sphingopyxis sp. YF1]